MTTTWEAFNCDEYEGTLICADDGTLPIAEVFDPQHAPLISAARELFDGLAWALDILEINDALIRSRLPQAWAEIDHDANARAFAKARAAIAKAEEDSNP